ncbi:MAG: hypothetical protein U5M72_06805 [Pseudomonas sp.]|nr:hypothetical protein [Pseudomonas sp.]
MTNLQLVPPPAYRPMSITSEAFLPKLSAFNDLTRAMREAGVTIEAMSFLDGRIFVRPGDIDLLARRFGHEVRAQRYRTSGKFTRHVVTIRTVDVVWFTPIKEQDQ